MAVLLVEPKVAWSGKQ